MTPLKICSDSLTSVVTALAIHDYCHSANHLTLAATAYYRELHYSQPDMFWCQPSNPFLGVHLDGIYFEWFAAPYPFSEETSYGDDDDDGIAVSIYCIIFKKIYINNLMSITDGHLLNEATHIYHFPE